MLYWSVSRRGEFRGRPLSVPGLFIAGTDTEVGKTHVACLIARQLLQRGIAVGACKPVATGIDASSEDLPPESDPVRLWEAIGRRAEPRRITPQCFTLPAAPPVAAAAQGSEVNEPLLLQAVLWWQRHCEFLLVEGVGGWFSPLSQQMTVADLAVLLGLPVVLVVPDRLGAVSQTLSALHAIARYGPGCPVAAVVLNRIAPSRAETETADNYRQLRAWCPGIPLLRLEHHGQEFFPEADWLARGN